jgi:hypothetical protein
MKFHFVTVEQSTVHDSMFVCTNIPSFQMEKYVSVNDDVFIPKLVFFSSMTSKVHTGQLWALLKSMHHLSPSHPSKITLIVTD